MNSTLYEKLENLSHGKKLPSHDELFALADKVSSVLENETGLYRKRSKNGNPGGLLNFTLKRTTKLPVIVVPDLHARSYFLFNILNYVLPNDFSPDLKEGTTVFEALCQKKVYLVCVGDLLHSELRGRDRWIAAFYEFHSGNETGPAMCSEMAEGLSLLSMVMLLKCEFIQNFHVLKGNHENILNQSREGDYAFCKFANEGEMVHRFMKKYYGEDVAYVISCFEKSLPLVACFNEVVISHSEPLKKYKKTEIINGVKNDSVVKGLTWTENNRAILGSVEYLLKQLTNRDDYLNARYLGGHRPVVGNYSLRQNGLYIQIHNPEKQNIALVYLNKVFEPEKNIVCVGA